jgi:hypothetical protein
MLMRIASSLVRLHGYPQEYMCCSPEDLDGKAEWLLDDRHVDPRGLLLLGYCPLIMSIRGVATDRPHILRIRISGNEVARMTLQPVLGQEENALFRGTAPWQSFLPPWKNALDRLRQLLNQRREGNVTQGRAEYDLLRIGYSQPRVISLAVVGDSEAGNIFPTDLNGPDGSDGHLLSLRWTGKACAQVQERRSLILCHMPPGQARTVYGLGARHMKEPGPLAGVHAWEGSFAGHPLPEGALSARHLEVTDHADAGIHRIFRCRCIREQAFRPGSSLAHVHAAMLAALGRYGRAVAVDAR